MSVALKIVVGLGAALAALVMSATALVGGAVVAGGVATVSLHTTDGPDLRLAVPGALITAVAASAGEAGGAQGHFGDSRLLAELDREIDVDLASAGRLVGEMLAVLEQVPDATLVEVRDGGDLVRVVKRGGTLSLRVVDGHGDLDLEVRLPIRTARLSAGLLLG